MVLAIVGMQLHTTLDSVQRIGILEAQYQELFRQGQEINRKLDRLIERTKPCNATRRKFSPQVCRGGVLVPQLASTAMRSKCN